MDNAFANAQNDGQGKEDSWNGLSNDRELSCQDHSKSQSKKLVRRTNSHRFVHLKVRELQRSKSCIKDSFLHSIHVFDKGIPKHMVSIDEKYLRRCLEFIHVSASQATPCNFSMNLGWGNMGIFSDDLDIAKIQSENTYGLAKFDFDCPLLAGTGSGVMGPAGHWIVGSIMGSNSMLNILKSPLLHQYGAYDGDGNSKKVSSSKVKGSMCYSFMNTPGGFRGYSSHKLDKEAQIPGSHKYGTETLHERLFSVSSTNSTCSDQTSSSLSSTVTQGMLQCTWKGGNPHFVFSLGDQKVVYVANLCDVDSADDKALDYMYLFHSRKGGLKEHRLYDKESHLVGKMKVSTSFSLCPNNSRIMEREFVLFGCYENFAGELQSSSHELWKNKLLSGRVAQVFRTNNSFKKRTTSRFGGSSSIVENSSWDPFQETDDNIDALAGAGLLENHFPPNLELAAILVKDHLPEKHQESVGGWGLNFLKNVAVKQAKDTTRSSVLCGCFARDTDDCSTSMDVLIPAGLHGGPRTRNGGPSSLIERWRSGGYCDCGGWDIGCPLTVFKSRSTNKEVSSPTDMQGGYKLIDLFIQGSENGAPPLRMVNTNDGLYFVQFQSTLSALQSFAIAVAFIHAQSSALQPKYV